MRLENVDTPEIHGACQAEVDLAHRAKAFTDAALDRAIPTIERIGRVDRYGRTIARVRIDGADLGELLIAAGLGPEALDALHERFVDRAAA